jgi:hypothetical protein
LAGALLGCPLGLMATIGLTVVQTLNFLVREGSFKAFPVQVRLGYLLLLLAGLFQPLGLVHWIQFAGTIAVVLVDYCPLARLLSQMPWNRRTTLSLALVTLTFLRPPVRGSILDAV